MAFFWKKKNKEEEAAEIKSLDEGLQKTKMGLFARISRAIAGKSKVDDVTLDEIEEALIESDLGVDTTLKIIDLLEDRVARDKYMDASELNRMLKEEIATLLSANEQVQDPFDFSKKPYVIMVVGVNGQPPSVNWLPVLKRMVRKLCSAQPTRSVRQRLSN